METYLVEPLSGIGPVRLGQTRAESRHAMAPAHAEPFEKHKGAPLVDMYHGGAVQVHFDANDCVEFIEVGRSLGRVRPLLWNIDVFATPAEEVVKLVESREVLDKNDPEPGYSFVFPAISLAFWRPVLGEEGNNDDDDDGRYFETVGVGIPGLFESS